MYPMIHGEFLLHRHPENPLIKPADFPGGADGVRNCGTAMLGDETILLVSVDHRADGWKGRRGRTSHVARSKDGLRFTFDPEPFLVPESPENDPFYAGLDQHPIDTRITQIGDTYFIDRLAAEGVEFIGFPECSINGYRYSANMLWLKQDGPEIGVLQKKAIEKGVYLGVGFAEQDAEGKKWEIQVVIGPDGKIVGWHRKNWLTKEKGYIEASADHNVFEVKGTKMGILICADGTDFRNLKATVDGGAKILYGPHANTTGGTIAKWYNFRAKWGGPWNETPAVVDRDGEKVEMPTGGWIAGLKVYAALCNHAGLYNPEFNPPSGPDTNAGWASGAWFIGPDGATLAQMPPSGDKNDSKEFILVHNVPLAAP